MRTNRPLKILLVCLGCLLILLSFPACQPSVLDDTEEPERETQEPGWDAFREGILDGQDATVINNRLYLYDHLISFWNEQGEDATVDVHIRAYDIYDIDPALVPTLYNGSTYKEYVILRALADQIVEVSVAQLIEDPTNEQYIEQYREAYATSQSVEEKIKAIELQQRTKKLQKLVDLLKSVGIHASFDQSAYSIEATLSKKDVMILAESDCLFVLVYDPMKIPAAQH